MSCWVKNTDKNNISDKKNISLTYRAIPKILTMEVVGSSLRALIKATKKRFNIKNSSIFNNKIIIRDRMTNTPAIKSIIDYLTSVWIMILL